MSSLTKDLHKHGTVASWAGEFDCHVCRRKRLIAAEFSQNQIKNYRAKGDSYKMKCKVCVSSDAEKERAAAASSSSTRGLEASLSAATLSAKGSGDSSRGGGGGGGAASGDGEKVTCSMCKASLDCGLFTNNQLDKARKGKAWKGTDRSMTQT